jgi:hypothetical protein
MKQPNGQDKKTCNGMKIFWKGSAVLAVGRLLCLVKLGLNWSRDLSMLQGI